jgi:hypothetical protein
MQALFRGVVLSVVLLGAAAAEAQSNAHPFALGIELGDPAGLTAKYWRNNDEAVQLGFGLRSYYRYRRYYEYYGNEYAPLFTIDYAYHFGAFGPRNRRWYFRMGLGVGGGLGWYDGCYREWWGTAYCSADPVPTALGRVPISFNAYLARARLELYAQIAPGLRLFPEFRPIMMGGLGARFYF